VVAASVVAVTRDEAVPLRTEGSGEHPSRARRRGEVVLRERTPSTPAVLALLRHFERVGFAGAPRVVEPGTDDDGNELLTFVPGTSPHPRAWSDEAVPLLGDLLRRAHAAAAGFELPVGEQWREWPGEDLARAGSGPVVLGHRDVGPWNVVADHRGPHALIDWEFAGPVPVVVELAEAAWLNAQLHDDDVAEAHGLPAAEVRARQVGLLLDGYRLSRAQRRGFVDVIVEVAVRSARSEAVLHGVGPASEQAVTDDGFPLLWSITWRTRSAAWVLDHRRLLEAAVAR